MPPQGLPAQSLTGGDHRLVQPERLHQLGLYCLECGEGVHNSNTDDTFRPGSPIPYVEQVLDGLATVIRTGEEPAGRLAVLMDNYGATFQHDAEHTQRDSAYRLGLHSLGAGLRALAADVREPLEEEARTRLVELLGTLLARARAIEGAGNGVS